MKCISNHTGDCTVSEFFTGSYAVTIPLCCPLPGVANYMEKSLTSALRSPSMRTRTSFRRKYTRVDIYICCPYEIIGDFKSPYTPVPAHDLPAWVMVGNFLVFPNGVPYIQSYRVAFEFVEAEILGPLESIKFLGEVGQGGGGGRA